MEREDWRVVGIITSAPPRTRRSLTCGRIQPVLRLRAAQDRGQRLSRGRFQLEERLEWATSTGNALIGTLVDAIAKLEELVDMSGGRVDAFFF